MRAILNLLSVFINPVYILKELEYIFNLDLESFKHKY